MTGPDVEQSRPFVNAEIERLMEVLDTLDPDPDLEATGDEEPWLCPHRLTERSFYDRQ
jgi:hypothetical protein